MAQGEATNPPASPPLNEHWSTEIFYWFTSTHPLLRGGKAATDFENLDYPGYGGYTPGISIGMPVSRTGMLNISGFITRGATSTTLSQNVDLFAGNFTAGELLTANYTIKNLEFRCRTCSSHFLAGRVKDGASKRCGKYSTPA
jgi:hypothetical protein